MNVDSHVHSSFSIDSAAALGDMVESAIAKGFDAVCFTEHFDLNPLDSGTGFFDCESFTRAIDEARDRYTGRIEILKGLEFSEPHRYPDALELNSSPLRKGYGERYPSELIPRAYLDSGGRAVTLGSDAHRVEDVGADFDRLDIPADCEPCFFKRRKRVPIGAGG